MFRELPNIDAILLNPHAEAVPENAAAQYAVTIVVGSTKSEAATTDASAFDILREVVRYVTPASPINF